MGRKLLTVLLLGAASMAHAGIGAWTALGPAGGSIRQIAYGTNPATVFAVTAGGFYRSQDGGANWRAIKTDFFNAPTGLAIDPSDASRVYVVTPDSPSLYVSTDGGATLAPVGSVPTAVTQGWQVVVSQDGRTLFVSSGARVFRSTDRGVSWTERAMVSSDPAARVLRMVIDPTDATRVYAAATISSSLSGVLRTQDGGQSWEVVLSGAPASLTVPDIAVSASNPLQVWAAAYNGVYRSTDRGTTWSSMLIGQPAGAVAVDPANSATVYVGLQSGAVQRSTNSGVQWTDVSAVTGGGQVATLAVHPTQTGRVLEGNLGGLFGTSDAGATWTAQQTGILGSAVSGMSYDSATGRVYFNSGVDGIHYDAFGNVGTVVPVNNAALLQLLLNPNQQLVTAILAQPGRLLASLSTGLARSLDGGATWSLVQVAPTGTRQLFSLASSVTTPQTLLAAGTTRLFRSTDGGTLWTQITAGIPVSASFDSVLVAPTDGRAAYASLYDSSVFGPNGRLGVYRSSDGGLTWSPASSTPAADPRLLAVDPTSATTLYGSTDTALTKSIDGGTTWSALNFVASEWKAAITSLVVDPRRPQTLYAASSYRIARTVDGGTTWQTLRDATALPIWSPVLFYNPQSTGMIYAGTSTQGVQQFIVATDLALSGSGPATPTGVGVPLVYRFSFSNRGPLDATGAKVEIHWAAAATNVTVSSSSGTCAVAPTSAICTVDIFRVGSSAIVTLTVAPSAAGIFEVQGALTSDMTDVNPVDNDVLLQTTVAARADLSLVAAGPATAQTGSNIAQTLTVQNAGPNAAVAPTLSYQLASGLAPTSVTSSQGTCAVNTPSALVTCTLSDVASGGSATVTVNSSAATAGSFTSFAQLNSGTADGSVADNSASTTVTVTQAPSQPSGGGSGGSSGGSSGGGGTGGGGVSTSAGGGGGGGALDLWGILALAAAAGRVRARKSSGRRLTAG